MARSTGDHPGRRPLHAELLAPLIAPERARRFPALRVDLRGALNLVGALIKYLSVAFALPFVVALGYGEPSWPFALSGALTAGAGWGLEHVTRGKERIGPREGFFVVAATWAAAAFFMSLPYLFSGDEQLASPLSAYFESMSGMTTTGASVLTDIEALPRSLLLWRQFTQWIGGMGIIVLALAVLPRLRVGGRQLLESELPGPEVERLTTSIRTVARRLWGLYVGLTLVMIAVLTLLGWAEIDERMTLYDAVAHAFSTLPTGGFSTHGESIQFFGPPTQWAIALFMIVAGVNFALLFRAVRRQVNPGRDEELRLYLLILLLATAAVLAKLLTRGVYDGEEAVRHAVFQSASIMTTTGFASADFAQWPIFAGMVLVVLMVIGGSAGSTAGALKVVRVLVLTRVLRRELDQTVHQEAVVPLRVNGAPIDERTVRGVTSFVLLYAAVFVLGMLGLVVTEALATARSDLAWEEAVSATATTLGNVGPGLGFLGPFGSFESFAPVSKVIMIALMWMGRLELIPVVVLLTRGYWRR